MAPQLGIFDFRAFLNLTMLITESAHLLRQATPTHLGKYNPDWAVVTENDEKLYLVREIKNTHDRDKRRGIENRKIDCGKAHFKALGVNFKEAINIYEVLSK